MRGGGDALPATRQLLLAGGGHSHALLLRTWAMRPESRPRQSCITLVSRQGGTLYSGVVPALVAGLRRPEACAIDLRSLCDRAEVAFVQAEITGLDPAQRELRLAGRPALRFDALSLDVGAVTTPAHGGGGLAVKPLEPFLAWCAALPAGEGVRIRGGGAAAVELALALRARGHPVRLLLRGERLSLGSAAAGRAGERLLAAVDGDAGVGQPALRQAVGRPGAQPQPFPPQPQFRPQAPGPQGEGQLDGGGATALNPHPAPVGRIN